MDSNRFFISIIIPCFNEADNIGTCIDSIESQHYDGSFEIIAVDNGSTDNTVGIIKDMGIILEHAQKKGPAAAKNKGIKKAKGDIIVFIDADCIAHPDWIKNIISPFNDREIGCVAGEISAHKPQTIIEEFLTKKKHLSQSINISHSFRPYAATANAAYRKEVFEKVGLFDERLFTGEDADMSWRMQLESRFKLKYCPEAIVFHPHETELKSLFRQKERHAYGSVMLYKKYRRFWKPEHKTLKQLYWEYHSIVRRSLFFGIYKLKRYFGFKSSKLLPFDEYQLILELACKAGMIRGSLRHMVWFV